MDALLNSNISTDILSFCNQLIEQQDLTGITQLIGQHQLQSAEWRDQLLEQLRLYWLEKQEISHIASFEKLSYIEQSKLTRRRASPQHVLSVSLLAFGLLDHVSKAWQPHLQHALEQYYKQQKISDDLSLFPSYFDVLLQLQPKILNDCIGWHQPYLLLRLLEKNGLVDYQADIFTRSFLSVVAYHRDDNTNYPQTTEWHNIFKNFTTDKVIYQRELPQIFQQPSHIHLSTVKLENDFFLLWQRIILALTQQEKLSRTWLIEQILLIQNRDWDKKLIDFFADILPKLQVTSEEYLQHQAHLIALLDHPQNPTVNVALQLVEPLIHLEKFDLNNYLIALQAVMYRQSFKASLKNLVKQLNTLLKTKTEQQQQILQLLSLGLIQPDAKLQISIVKILRQYLDNQPEQLSELISPYQTNLVADAKILLADYLVKDKYSSQIENVANNPSFSLEKYDYFSPENKIELPSTWQDLLFVMAEQPQADQLYQLDVMLSGWLKLQADFPKDYKKQLKAIIKTLSKVGDHSPINLFNRLWVDFLEDPSQIRTDLSYTQQHAYLRNHITTSRYLLFWFHHFATLAQQKIALPLLSLPTHAPSYIQGEILIERILSYQNQNITLNPWDFALAIARTPRHIKPEALNQLQDIQCEHTRHVLSYCFGQLNLKDALQHQQQFFNLEATSKQQWYVLWQTALLTHAPTDQPDLLQVESLSDIKKQYNYSAICNRDYAVLMSGIANLYDYVKGQQYGDNSGLTLCLLRHFTPINTFHSDWSYLNDYGLSDDRLHQNPQVMLERFSQADYPINDATTLIFACESFNATKVVRLGLADCLSQCLAQQRLFLTKLANYYRDLIDQNYAPFNRVLDIFAQIKGLSPHTDHQLADLLSQIIQIQPLPETLPKQFAKLFELYYELSIQYQIFPSESLRSSLTLWQTTFKTLKPIIQKINQE